MCFFIYTKTLTPLQFAYIILCGAARRLLFSIFSISDISYYKSITATMQGNINDDGLNGSGDCPSNDGGETRSSSSFVVSDMLPFPYSTDAFNVNNPFLEPISQFESCLDESCMGAIVDKIVQTCPFADPNSSLTRENSGFVIGEPLEETHPPLFEVPFPSSGLSSYSVSSSSSTPTSPISFSTTYWNFGVENNQEHGLADEIGKSEEEEQGVVNRGTGIENKDYKNEWESNTNLDDKKSNINVNNQSTQSFILQNPTSSFMESLSGSNDFTNAELKKIMEAGGRLADMALTDPKRVKRYLSYIYIEKSLYEIIDDEII